MEKIKDFLLKHSNAILIVSLVCVLTIATVIYQSIPIIQEINYCNQIINKVDSSKLKENASSSQSEEEQIFNNTEATESTKYSDTEEYKELQSEINFMKNRISDLDSDLSLTLNRNVTDFFSAYTTYSMTPTPKNLESMKEFMTDDYYDEFKKKDVTQDIYTVYYVRLADLDKSSVSAFVQVRNSNYYIISYVEQDDSWKINDISKVKSE